MKRAWTTGYTGKEAQNGVRWRPVAEALCSTMSPMTRVCRPCGLSVRTGWPGVSVLSVGEMATF